ncbi:SET domain-containing protein [Fusarium mundagurra]|uniref:SET domain-containing protein n=1 Tax=Fusarium mundagurra TaxID=1567541 RepID=A0A8H6DEZ1_9HYPO|nr:SET domain-containing protein [Fusarium mundagurra]
MGPSSGTIMGRLEPPAFAAVDYEGLWFGKLTRAFKPEFLHHHTVILNGATNAEEYGKLIHWDDHPDAEEWVRTRKQYLPGDALLVLEMQERLMKFLVECCHQILHEISPEKMISDEYPVQPEPTLKTDSDATGFVSLAVITAEAPYKRPAGLDLSRLATVLEARMLTAEDHIWALREDPAYFSEQFREMLDHREEMLPDTKGNSHPVLEPYRINTLWSRFALDQAVEGPAEQLEHSHFAAPPIRNRFVRLPPPDPYTLEMNVIRRSESKITYVEKQVMYLIQTMWEDSWGLFIARLPLTVDELDRLLQSDRNADALISAHVARILGDFAIIGHCLKQLELYQPWAAQFDQVINTNIEVYQQAWGLVRGNYGQLNEAFLQGELDEAARLAEPSGGKFAYPYSKRRTKEKVDTLRRAEANLDIVWAKIDQVTKKHVTDFEKTYVHHFLSQPRTLRRTAEWVEPTQTDSKVELITSKDLWELSKPLSKLFLDEPAQEPKKFKPEDKSKTKVKTKGDPTEPATTQEATPPADEAEPATEATQPTFAVDAKALKVFRTLFFDPEVTSTPGLIPWNDFLYAMAATGFEIEKLYGSVWQFTPTKLDVARGIHFHEPHPMGKIPFETARRHGRRLARAYGWHGAKCLYMMKETADGHGLFAKELIKAGTRIIHEKPILTVSQAETKTKTEYRCVVDQVADLNDSEKQRLMDLYYNDKKLREFSFLKGQLCPGTDLDAGIVLAKFYTNAASITSGGLECGLFTIFCRMNHSCTPNICWVYDEPTGFMEVYAVRDIDKDEEITNSYIEVAISYQARMKELSNWGFACQCAACEGPDAAKHDERRRRIAKIKGILDIYQDAAKSGDAPKFAEIPKTDLEALRLGEESLALLSDEGLVEQLGVMYGLCAKFAKGAGLHDFAEDYEEMEFEILVITTGEYID